MSKAKVTFSSTKVKAGPSRSHVKSKKFEIPALSIPLKDPPIDPQLERLKKKTIRRNAPPGEDMKKIKEIIRQINKEPVSVQEFVGLIGPYTGDKGNDLKSVMEEDLASFRKMAKKVYDNMTRDVGDVLANEQIHITEYFIERTNINYDKMMRTIDNIFRYVPNFDFDMYYRDKNYVNNLFKLPKELDVDPQEAEMHKRQQAYHRLEWMRTEGVRLNQENTQLRARLKELKQLQKHALMESQQKEEDAEMRKTQLETAQIELQERLEDLNRSIEESAVQTEQVNRMRVDSKLTKKPKSKIKSTPCGAKKTPDWNVQTARALEHQEVEQASASAANAVSTTSVVSKTGAVRKRARPKIQKKPAIPRYVSPFHYSPVKTPPEPPCSARQRSPFHYSPPKTPPGSSSVIPASTEPTMPTRTVRMEATTTVVETAPAEQMPGRLPPARRSQAPKDTWGGFQ
ncbi:hypothetical protein FQR65_LT13867 [Abscondita terminalis]|nr:hypothetical protein FQR65_LT13867 [Abscondita terminalis]